MNSSVRGRVRISHVGIAILKYIAITGVVVTLAAFPGMALAIAPFIKKKKYSPKSSLKRNIRSLVKNGLIIERTNSQGETRLELSARGRWEAMIHNDHARHAKSRWDGVWHVIIFDIPSAQKKRVRGELHRALKLYGFRMVQKSVWVYPHDCETFLGALKEHLGVTHDILYMRVKYIENDTRLRREFGI